MHFKTFLIVIICLQQFPAGSGEKDAFIVYTTISAMKTINGATNSSEDVTIPKIPDQKYLAFDYGCQVLFCFDEPGTIHRGFFNNGKYTSVVAKDQSVRKMYFDGLYNYLYWTTWDNSIKRIKPYAANPILETIISLNSDHYDINSLAVDPLELKLYWTNKIERAPSIQRANTNGAHIESIITTDIKDPNGLTLDHVAKKLYWIDNDLDKIELADYDGSNRRVLRRNAVTGPGALAVLGEHVYWIEWTIHTSTIFRANKRTGDGLELMRLSTGDTIKDLIAVSNQTLMSTNTSFCPNHGQSSLPIYSPLFCIIASILVKSVADYIV